MNKKYISKILILLIIITIPYDVFAENFKPAIIGILDIQRIKKESKAIVSIRDQITSERLKYEKKFRSKEDVLRKEEQEIAKQRSVLSEEAFKKKNTEFRKKVQNLQERMQKASQLLQKAEAEAIREFNNNLRPILIESSNSYSVNVVLFASQVAFAPRSLDLTSDVMKRLDAAIPAIEVKFQELAN
ncbi:MAG: hypothetical protein CFH01_01758 [Alphaproteobacteria bacterium MarineAlpha2_Bin1]|nr:MAG: hypothetical protein CFH01_01758 [Alphaproteobacteria bacterium MarineAlpha2_Bin1]